MKWHIQVFEFATRVGRLTSQKGVSHFGLLRSYLFNRYTGSQLVNDTLTS